MCVDDVAGKKAWQMLLASTLDDILLKK